VNAEQAEEQASLYVLGLLPPGEASAFEAAMAADPRLATLAAHLETAAAALASTAPPRDAPPALRARILAQVKREETDLAGVLVPFPGITPWLPWAAAACLAVVATCLTYDRYHTHLLIDSLINRDRRQQLELDHVQSQRLSLQDSLDSALAQVNSLHGQVADLKARDALSQIQIATLASMVKSAPQAMAVIAWDPASQRGILQPRNIPPANPDQDYQLWIIDPAYNAPVSAGVFDPATRANFQPLHPISKASKFAISLEKKGGSPAPQGPIVLVGG